MSLSDDFGGDVELLAAFQMNEESFIGLLAMSDAGSFVRADGQWHMLGENNAAFIGSRVVTVDEQFLDLFDILDKKGNTPTADQALSFAVEDDEENPKPEVEEAE